MLFSQTAYPVLMMLTKFGVLVACDRNSVLLWRRYALCYVLPVFWMTSCFDVMSPTTHRVYAYNWTTVLLSNLEL